MKLDLRFFDHNRNVPPGRIVTYATQSCETVFSDFEAFALCLGFEDEEGYLMKIARKFFYRNKYSEKETLEAHVASMNALHNHGYDFLKTLIRLPPLKFESPFHTKEIFSIYDNDLNEIKIVCYKEFKRSEVYNTFSLGYEDISKKVLLLEQIFPKTRTPRVPIMRIFRNGHICVIGDHASIEIVENIIPVINLLTKYHSNPTKMVAYYGLATSFCSVCNKPLTDPISIERGIGPVCAGRLGMRN